MSNTYSIFAFNIGMILRRAYHCYLISKHISTASEAKTIIDPVTANIARIIRASDVFKLIQSLREKKKSGKK